MPLMPSVRNISSVIAVLAATAAALAQGKSELALSQLAFAAHVPNEVIVQYRAGTTDAQKSAALAQIGRAHV